MLPTKFCNAIDEMPPEQQVFEKWVDMVNFEEALYVAGYYPMSIYKEQQRWMDLVLSNKSERFNLGDDDHDYGCFKMDMFGNTEHFTRNRNDAFVRSYFCNDKGVQVYFEVKYASTIYESNTIGFSCDKATRLKLKKPYESLRRKMRSANSAIGTAQIEWEESFSGRYHTHIKMLQEVCYDLSKALCKSDYAIIYGEQHNEIDFCENKIKSVYSNETKASTLPLFKFLLETNTQLQEYTSVLTMSEEVISKEVSDAIIKIEEEVARYNAQVNNYREQLTFQKLIG